MVRKSIIVLLIPITLALAFVLWQLKPYTGWHEEFYDNGVLRYRVYYSSSKPEGVATEFYPNGKVKSRRTYRDGELEGDVTTYYMDGPILAHKTYREGRAEGVARAYYPDGTVQLELSYREGKKHGLATKYYGNGSVLGKLWFEGGEPQGATSEFYTKSGQLIQNAKNDTSFLTMSDITDAVGSTGGSTDGVASEPTGAPTETIDANGRTRGQTTVVYSNWDKVGVIVQEVPVS